jgi:hypothetical protein
MGHTPTVALRAFSLLVWCQTLSPPAVSIVVTPGLPAGDLTHEKMAPGHGMLTHE